MRRSRIPVTLALAALALTCSAQIHKVAPPEEVVRAVGVYEWIGDRAKPTASRFIPVSLFIDGSLQDAAVYLARPIPMALDSGTIYEVDHSGIPAGTLDVLYASRLQSTPGSAEYDDGWFGYGTFAPPAPPKPAKPLKVSKAPSQIVSSKPDIKGNDDPDRPHMIRRSEPATTDAGTDPAADTKSGTTDASSSGSAKSSGSTGSVPAADPDRPTLRKRSPEEAKKARKEAEASSATGLATSLNDDPNRPTLHRGATVKPLSEADMPKLKGVPADLHQETAVSDAKNRPPHDFSRPWADATERATVLARMQELAKAQVATYQAQNPARAAGQSASQSGSDSGNPPVLKRGTPNSKLRHPKAKPAAPPPPAALVDEQLTGYTLSYGGSPTYVYTARTDGEGASLIYVTVVAQADTQGQLQPAIQSVTDATHLDRTPWMRPIDAVDAEASNRASLLFELREENARQFALYRVIAARAEQIFLTGTTQ